jgi:cofilin
LYQELKLKKKYKYIIFGLSPDNTEIVKLKTAATSADYEDFVEELPENECRWAVFDLEFRNEEGSLRNKIVFIHWYVLPLISTMRHHPPLSSSLFRVANGE